MADEYFLLRCLLFNSITMLGVFAAFVVGQIFLAVKLITRLTFFGGQMALYEAAAGTAALLPPASEASNK
jgi:hypothetical protein